MITVTVYDIPNGCVTPSSSPDQMVRPPGAPWSRAPSRRRLSGLMCGRRLGMS